MAYCRSNAKSPSQQTAPCVTFSSKEIKQTTNSMNQVLVLSALTINTKIRRVFIDQGSSVNTRWLIVGRPTLNKIGAVIATSILIMKFITDNGEVGVLKRDKSEAERYHGATLHNSKEQLPRLAKPKTTTKVQLVDLEPPG
ncbi:hypothetical protein PIB30_081080 [Stylosanthes scabra]|uniref:Uncharacterized protein n=1 Tax=Stylosanthes scabra TaxID=79078 RepID=A0ABU6WUC9_9FABA|nr:hypothetical protein [Stylosanthes scabra]